MGQVSILINANCISFLGCIVLFNDVPILSELSLSLGEFSLGLIVFLVFANVVIESIIRCLSLILSS